MTVFSASNKTLFNVPIEGTATGGLTVNRTALSAIDSASLTVIGPTTTAAANGWLYGAKISGPVSGSGLLGTSVGLYVSKPTNSGGTTGTTYGLYVEKPTVGIGSNWTIFSEGSINVGDSIVTPSTTFELINTTATAVSFAGAATTLNIGNATGITTFNGTVNIASGKTLTIGGIEILTGAGLGSGITGSSLTGVGTIATGTWQGTAIAVGYGGTGTTSGSITGTGALTFTAGGTNTNVTLVPNGTGTVDVSSKRITNVATPTASTDAANKGYVDTLVQGIDVHASVRATTTANITLSAPQTIDGVAVIAGNRVLVKNQSTLSQNGVYIVNASAWVRATDFDSTANVSANAFFFVEEGTLYGDTGWTLTNDGTPVIGTDALNFTQFSGAGMLVAGNGLTKTGNSLDVVGTADRISVATDSIDIASTYAGQASITTVGTIATGTWSGSFGAVSGANLTSLTAGNLSGTIPSGVLGNSTVYIGTTGVALNRTSGTQTLAGLTLTTPDIGVATATSVNKLVITAPASGSTLTIVDGKTLTISETLTFSATSAASVAFGGGGTVIYSGGNIGTASADSLNSSGLVTGSGFITTNGALGINFKDGTGTGGTASGDTRLYTTSGDLYLFANGGAAKKVLNAANVGSSALAFGQSSLNNNLANGVTLNAGIYTMRMATSSTAATKMTVSGAAFVDNVTDQIIIPASSTWAASVKVIAYNPTNSASASWDIITTFKRGASGNATMVSDPIVSAFGDSALDMSTIDITTGTNNILITVTCEAASATVWAASITTLEVS